MNNNEQFNVLLMNQLDQQVAAFFTDEELDQFAQQTQFTQRAVNKLCGSTFFKLIVFNSENLSEQSLNGLCVDLSIHHQVDMTKQSLNERFNDRTLLFLKRALENVLSTQITDTTSLNYYCKFKRILIKDSTSFQIDESLKDIYPGSGGSGSAASIRIQFEYNILTGTITALKVTPFTVHDATDSKESVVNIHEGDLIIRDLGYMSMEVLKAIMLVNAFFLCRSKCNAIMYEYIDDQKKIVREIDFLKLRHYMERLHLNQIEKLVLLGKDKMIEVRLIICLLPADIVANRLQKLYRENKGKKPSAEYLARAYFNLFITNAPKEFLGADKVAALYTIRWQIELLFKVWKSIAHINKVKKVKRERFECYIYAKLLIIVLCWKLLWSVNMYIYKTEKAVVSGYKFFATLMKNMKQLTKIWFEDNCVNQGLFVYKLCQLSKKYLLCETKNNDKNYMDTILNALHFNAISMRTNSIGLISNG